jgi:hypothetical protein
VGSTKKRIRVGHVESALQHKENIDKEVNVKIGEASEEMVVGPPKSAVGSRLQTALSC